MTLLTHWTTELVDLMPHIEGERYEVIGGKLYVTNQPHFRHQAACDNIIIELGMWSRQTSLGRTLQAPGVIFADDNAVAPDVVWIRRERMPEMFGPDGKLHAAPDLVIEVVSPGKANEERDRDKKLALYSRQAVPEYWIADWGATSIDIYRYEQGELHLVSTLSSGDTITSPLLPGFTCTVARFFEL